MKGYEESLNTARELMVPKMPCGHDGNRRQGWTELVSHLAGFPEFCRRNCAGTVHLDAS